MKKVTKRSPVFNVGDKVRLAGINAKVAVVTAYGGLYLIPETSGEHYHEHHYTLIGMVFAYVSPQGLDKYGNRITTQKGNQ